MLIIAVHNFKPGLFEDLFEGDDTSLNFPHRPLGQRWSIEDLQ